MTRYAILFLSMLAFSLGVGRIGAQADDRSSGIASPLRRFKPPRTRREEKKDDEKKDDDADKKDDDTDKKSDADKDAKEPEKKTESSESEKKESADEKKEKEDEKPAAKESEEKKSPPADEAAKEKSDAKPDEKAAAKPEAKKRKTHKVEPKRLKVDLTLDGTFVARKTEEVAFRPEAWTDYEIDEVVEHGKKVRKGETLFKFDDEKLNEAIADLELEQRLNELAIRKAEEELPRMEKTLKMDFDAAERSNQQAKEDFERYNEIDRPMTVKIGRVHGEVLRLHARLREGRARTARENVRGRRPHRGNRGNRSQAAAQLRRVRRVQPGKRQAQPRRNAERPPAALRHRASRNRSSEPRWRWPARKWRCRST